MRWRLWSHESFGQMGGTMYTIMFETMEMAFVDI